MRGSFLRLFTGQVPDAIFQRELFAVHSTNLGEDPDFEAAHREKQLRVLLGVDADEGIVPLDSRERSRQTLLHVPEDSAAEIDVVLDEPHAAVLRPAALVIISDDVVVSRVGVRTQVPLYQVAGLVGGEAEEDVKPVDIA